MEGKVEEIRRPPPLALGLGASAGISARKTEVYKITELKQSKKCYVLPDSISYYFELITKLGEGGFGSVYLASPKADILEVADMPDKVVIKKCSRRRNPQCDKSFRVESQVQKFISNSIDDMLSYYGCFVTAKQFYIVFEYFPGTELFKYVVDGMAKSQHEKSIIAYKTALTLSKLHKLGVIHRDIKLENE